MSDSHFCSYTSDADVPADITAAIHGLLATHIHIYIISTIKRNFKTLTSHAKLHISNCPAAAKKYPRTICQCRAAGPEKGGWRSCKTIRTAHIPCKDFLSDLNIKINSYLGTNTLFNEYTNDTVFSPHYPESSTIDNNHKKSTGLY